jgi:hypothetical protein
LGGIKRNLLSGAREIAQFLLSTLAPARSAWPVSRFRPLEFAP